MKDKAIRKILIEYLKASDTKIRIFQEKSIGSSICDVMTVTDCLTGYEIKSDADSYQRFDSQVQSYNIFFDKNYIVVGQKHLLSAQQKVPKHWGIICIKSDDVELFRKANNNPLVDRRSQLSILWKLELKNLLVKNDMPLFAQKNKGYIANRIAEVVAPDLLGKQIAEELFNRDYSTYQAEDYTIKQENPAFTNLPEEELVDSLSEENLEEFTLDQWIALYHKAQIVKEQKNFDYDKTLIKRAEHIIKYTDITPTLGAPWISESIINDFVEHLCGKDVPKYYKPKVAKESITGNWHITQKKSNDTAFCANLVKLYGTSRFNALQILEATLNLREIKLMDGTKINQKDTVAALEKQKLIVREFNDWVWKSEDRIWEIEEAYNKMFEPFEKAMYDGSGLSFPEMSSDFSLYDYQKDAVQKIIKTKNTLLAFDVGAGKTFIMIAAAMKMRQMGISRKNMFVVPNNIVGQWEKIFTDLYPKAKVLTVDPKSFKANMRSKVLKQMRDADYDGIIIAYSCFEMIPLSVQYITDIMNKKANILNEEIKNVQFNSKYWGWGTTALERERDRIKKAAYDLIDSFDYHTVGNITFDQLEINTLFLDEAHNYKNIPLKTALKDLNGINIKGSKKCLDMQKKIRCVQDSNAGRGAVLATGTPLCNSISDAYAMQMYLQPEEMEERELHTFDNWVKTFALPEQRCEIDVDTSKYRMIRRFVKFFNLPELSKMFAQVAVFHATEQKNLPEFSGYTDVIIRKNVALSNYMKSLSKRSDDIRAKRVSKELDNMLKVSTDGRKAALDLNLVDCEQKYDEHSKIMRCAQKVYEIYCANPDCSQLIFCDYSTPKRDKFNVYSKIKELLIEMGIEEKEIAFIHSFGTEARKLKLFADVNAAKVKVLIGSTFKLGIGSNVQTKLKAIHHLDAPWRPADMVQREGRILRQGNENKNVDIYRYIAEGSFDAYSWQVLETKQGFISQFLSGSTYQRSAMDLEANVLTYAEVKALALAQPLMKVKAEKENELKNLTLLRAKEKEERKQLKQKYEELSYKADKLELRSVHSWCTEQALSNWVISKADLEKLEQVLTTDYIFGKDDCNIFYFSIFRIKLPTKQDDKKPFIFLTHNDESYIVYMSDKPKGNALRVHNFIKKFGKTREEIELSKLNAKKQMKEIEKLLETQVSYDEQIEAIEAELSIIDERLNVS